VGGLLRANLRTHREKVAYSDNLGTPTAKLDRHIRVADIRVRSTIFLSGRKTMMVVSESGDSLFGGLDIKVGNDGLYLAQGFYASMEFAIPGGLGAQIGTGLRPLVLTGDSGFQVTGVEIIHAPRHGCNPIVILVNNSGWGIFGRSSNSKSCWRCRRFAIPTSRCSGAALALGYKLWQSCAGLWKTRLNLLLSSSSKP
jgi:TPP-dependent 2-oxoacid decarboxylase